MCAIDIDTAMADCAMGLSSLCCLLAVLPTYLSSFLPFYRLPYPLYVFFQGKWGFRSFTTTSTTTTETNHPSSQPHSEGSRALYTSPFLCLCFCTGKADVRQRIQSPLPQLFLRATECAFQPSTLSTQALLDPAASLSRLNALFHSRINAVFPSRLNARTLIK